MRAVMRSFHFGGAQRTAPLGQLTRSRSRLRVTFSFAYILHELKGERPALPFVKVDDRLLIEGNLLLE